MVHSLLCHSFSWFRQFAECYEPPYRASSMQRRPPRHYWWTPLMDQTSSAF